MLSLDICFYSISTNNYSSFFLYKLTYYMSSAFVIAVKSDLLFEIPSRAKAYGCGDRHNEHGSRRSLLSVFPMQPDQGGKIVAIAGRIKHYRPAQARRMLTFQSSIIPSTSLRFRSGLRAFV